MFIWAMTLWIYRHFTIDLNQTMQFAILKRASYVLFEWMKNFDIWLWTYRKVSSSRLSWSIALSKIFRRLVKGKFDACVLWPLAKKFWNWVHERTSMFIPKLEHMYFKVEEDIMVVLYCNCQLNGLWVMPALMTDRFVNRWLKTWENNLLFTFSFSAPRAR